VAHDGEMLHFTFEQFQADKEVVKTALMQNGESLYDA
jgi:DNA replication protein DnaD